jgi:hypothetical protein
MTVEMFTDQLAAKERKVARLLDEQRQRLDEIEKRYIQQKETV